MATTFAILHGLVAVALLGAITHQTLAVWAPSGVPPRSFFGRFRAVPSAAFANAIIILYLVTALLGAVVYLYFKVHIRMMRDSVMRRSEGSYNITVDKIFSLAASSLNAISPNHQ